jgi:uncharacterized tellurite resistance protein B-like protein
MAEAAHPARTLPEDQRVDYLLVVAAVAFADGQVAEEELATVTDLCDALDITGTRREEILAAARRPDQDRVDQILDAMTDPATRQALLTDVITVVYADGRVGMGEAEEVARFAERLKIGTSQAVLIARYVEGAIGTAAGAGSTNGADDEPLTDELADGLTAVAKLRPQTGVRALYRRLRHKG